MKKDEERWDNCSGFGQVQLQHLQAAQKELTIISSTQKLCKEKTRTTESECGTT